MSENTSEVTDLGAIQGTEGGPELPDLRTIPVTEVKPEDVGTLSLRYVDGVAQLVVSGGTVLPAALTVVDGGGSPVAAYRVATATSRTALTTEVPFVLKLGYADDGSDLSGA